MRELRILSVAAAVWLGSATPSLSGDSGAETFGARRWPSSPRLELNEEPKLCAKVLSSAIDAFLGNLGDLDIGAAIVKTNPSVTMGPVNTADGSDPVDHLSAVELDLDGDGRRQVVVHRDNVFNSHGNWHISYVFPSPEAFEAAKASAIANWSKASSSQDPDPANPDLGAHTFFPRALTSEGQPIDTGNVWASPRLFLFEGRYYFAFAQNRYDLLSPRPITIYRLRASGRADPRCVINTVTSDRATEAFAALPAVGSFLSLIRTVGEPGPDSGTLHAETRHKAQAESAVGRAASRPWTVAANVWVGYAQGEYYTYGPRMLRFLEQWSELGLWNRREYQTLLASMATATESYAAFLRAEFGMSEPAATEGAKRVVENLLARRILIPAHYEEGIDPFYYFPRSALQLSVLHRDREEFEAEVALIKDQPTAKDEYSKALADAVEWTYGLDRLLALGANPNAVNEFGKSALMVAAHFDRVDSVRKLLRSGAKVGQLTTQSNKDWINMTRTRRTALMYAAENASAEVIKALLDAGADKSAVDSQRNGIGFYLTNNPRFTDEQRARGIEAIAAGAADVSRASFDCAGAQTHIEITICTSPALRAFDTEVADAFARLKQKGGSRVVAEQRAWLKVRDGACNADADADCLAELLRTRLRYLHLRLMESGPRSN